MINELKKENPGMHLDYLLGQYDRIKDEQEKTRKAKEIHDIYPKKDSRLLNDKKGGIESGYYAPNPYDDMHDML